jgi:hypothetical protein
MNLASGDRLGPYEVLAPIGAGWVKCGKRVTRLMPR